MMICWGETLLEKLSKVDLRFRIFTTVLCHQSPHTSKCKSFEELWIHGISIGGETDRFICQEF